MKGDWRGLRLSARADGSNKHKATRSLLFILSLEMPNECL